VVAVRTADEEEGRAEQLELDLRRDNFVAPALRDDLDIVLPSEVAAAIGVAEQTLASWRSDGVGPRYVKLGKAVFYRREELAEWIAANVTGTGGELKAA